jgi:hypothetical protein
MLTQAGVPNPSDAEIRRFKENVRAVTGKPIGVLADDGQVRAAAAADGRIRVDYSDYDAGVIAAGAKDILRRRAATQATAERAHAAGTKYVDEAVGGFYGNQVNAAIDLANLATKIPRSVTGTPGLARVEVTGEYWNQPLRREAAEIGAGLGLPIGRIGKAGTALMVGATATAGTQAVTGQDVETGRKLTPVERGLNGLGAVGGAAATRTEVGQVVAKTEAAVKRAAGKFPPGGGLAPELVTNEGVTVRVPDHASSAAENLNALAKGERLDMLDKGSQAGRKSITQAANEGVSEIAQSGVKRVKTDIGKEGVKAAQEQLVTINVARTEMMARLKSLPNQVKLSQKTHADVSKACNNIRDHITQEDLSGALRDVHGKMVRRSGDGYTFDHLDEVERGLKSLGTARNSLIQEMKNYQIGSKEYKILSQQADALQETSFRIKNFLGIK